MRTCTLHTPVVVPLQLLVYHVILVLEISHVVSQQENLLMHLPQQFLLGHILCRGKWLVTHVPDPCVIGGGLREAIALQFPRLLLLLVLDVPFGDVVVEDGIVGFIGLFVEGIEHSALGLGDYSSQGQY